MNQFEKIIFSILYEKDVNFNDCIWKSFIGKKVDKNIGKNIKVAILNAPCYGFGDIMFAQKLVKYIREWYGCHITIFTTMPDSHRKLGDTTSTIISPDTVKLNCRKFSKLIFPHSNDKFDIYLVAPLVTNFSPDKNDIKKQFKYSTNTNTFFMSEYNSGDDSPNMTFQCGVGDDRDGIFLTKPNKLKKLEILKNPYAYIYIASADHVSNARSCYVNFVNMICAKYYKKHKNLDIVVPDWIGDDIKYVKNISKQYYPNIILKTKNDTIEMRTVDGINKNILTIRADILPVDNMTALSLMKYSIKEILLTGDQSITDALSCCSKKNIFYQIADWKKDFANSLANEMPQPYLKNVSTSCGTMKAINYVSNYSNFLKKWDFRKNGRKKMDAIFMATVAIKTQKDYKILNNIIENSKSRKSLEKKVLSFF